MFAVGESRVPRTVDVAAPHRQNRRQHARGLYASPPARVRRGDTGVDVVAEEPLGMDGGAVGAGGRHSPDDRALVRRADRGRRDLRRGRARPRNRRVCRVGRRRAARVSLPARSVQRTRIALGHVHGPRMGCGLCQQGLRLRVNVAPLRVAVQPRVSTAHLARVCPPQQGWRRVAGGAAAGRRCADVVRHLRGFPLPVRVTRGACRSAAGVSRLLADGPPDRALRRVVDHVRSRNDPHGRPCCAAAGRGTRRDPLDRPWCLHRRRRRPGSPAHPSRSASR